MADHEKKTEKKPSANDRLTEIVAAYWRLILTSVALGLGLYLFIIFSPLIGITVPTIYFMPTVYVIALAFVRDRREDRMMTFSYAIFTGFLFLLVISLITPYISQLLSGS